jgi:hypothetical protein
VLALPVNTEIATSKATARVVNDDGGVEVAFSGQAPTQSTLPLREGVSSLTSYTKVDGRWQSTLNEINLLAAGSASFPRDVHLKLGTGAGLTTSARCSRAGALRLDVATTDDHPRWVTNWVTTAARTSATRTDAQRQIPARSRAFSLVGAHHSPSGRRGRRFKSCHPDQPEGPLTSGNAATRGPFVLPWRTEIAAGGLSLWTSADLTAHLRT